MTGGNEAHSGLCCIRSMQLAGLQAGMCLNESNVLAIAMLSPLPVSASYDSREGNPRRQL